MNTSMPTTPNDLSALLKGGGTPSGTNALLKGVFAGLTNAKSGQSESDSTAGSDFETMLDSPAVSGIEGEGMGNTGSGRCVLSAGLSATSTATLQIKGMVSAAVEVPAGETVATGVVSDTLQNPPSTKPATAGVKSVSCHGRARLANSLLASGTQNATEKGTCASADGVKPVVSEISSASASVPAIGLVTQVIIPAPVLITGNQQESGVSSSSQMENTSINTPVIEGEIIPQIVITDESSASPVKTGQGSAATASAPAKGLHTHAMLNRPAGRYFTHTDNLLPAIENHQCAVENISGVPAEQSVTTPITGELRRELIETVAALLAPLWSALPKILPEAAPVVPEGATTTEGEAALNGSGEKALGTAVTITLGSRPSFTIELPYPDSASSDPDSTTQVPSQTTQEKGGESMAGQGASAVQVNSSLRSGIKVAIADLAAQQLPALAAVLPKDLPMDFRIKLKAEIEAAWAKADSLPAAPAPETVPAVTGSETKRDLSGLSRGTGRLGFEVSKEVASSTTGQGLSFRAVAQTAAQLPAIKAEVPASPVELLIEMPGFGSLTAEIVAAQPALNPPEKKTAGRFGRAEKTAGDLRTSGVMGKEENILSEKTFLSAARQAVKSKAGEAGTDVAISADNMSAQFTSRRLTVDPLELPPRFNGRGELLPALNETRNFAASAETAASTTPAPVLAHRAVETIMNVVDAQRNGSANASSVNLHFKFGGDDLAVRVQMRGGEVLTQFITDSAELRSAISNEWQIMAGQGGAAGLRLLEPTIMPASAGVSTGFGSASQGQNHAQQQAEHQQQAQHAAAFPELRSLRRGSPVVAPHSETAPRVSITQPTSHHLSTLA